MFFIQRFLTFFIYFVKKRFLTFFIIGLNVFNIYGSNASVICKMKCILLTYLLILNYTDQNTDEIELRIM